MCGGHTATTTYCSCRLHLSYWQWLYQAKSQATYVRPFEQITGLITHVWPGGAWWNIWRRVKNPMNLLMNTFFSCVIYDLSKICWQQQLPCLFFSEVFTSTLFDVQQKVVTLWRALISRRAQLKLYDEIESWLRFKAAEKAPRRSYLSGYLKNLSNTTIWTLLGGFPLEYAAVTRVRISRSSKLQ